MNNNFILLWSMSVCQGTASERIFLFYFYAHCIESSDIWKSFRRAVDVQRSVLKALGYECWVGAFLCFIRSNSKSADLHKTAYKEFVSWTSWSWFQRWIHFYCTWVAAHIRELVSMANGKLKLLVKICRLESENRILSARWAWHYARVTTDCVDKGPRRCWGLLLSTLKPPLPA